MSSLPRWLAAAAAALTLGAAAPAAADLADRRQSVDHRLAALRTRVEATRRREAVLQRQIEAASARIRALERRAGDVSQRLVPLENELRLRELKLNRLDALFQVQSQRLVFLRAQYRIAVHRLAARLVAAYEASAPDALGVVLAARSLGEVVDGLEYVRSLADDDRRIATEVAAARAQVAASVVRTRRARRVVRQQAEIVAVRVRQVRALRDELVASAGRLMAERSRRRVSLASLSASERADASEIDALRRASAELAARLRAAQAGTVRRTSSSSGFDWPVSAPITSPFGWRWGRMHEGIDLGAAEGTPIAAAAAGTVVYAGWMEGYGNLTVIDHGGGLATAYGHQSRIVVAVGEQVSRGEIIGYVGSTGHSTGPHLHFEVRVDGKPVDPLGYL